MLALAGANWLTGGSWWSFWPIALWSVAFFAHYLVHKARSVDEHWVDERTVDLRSKSYDASHIDSIAERYDLKAPEESAKPK